jgi:hypothetical protein
LCDWNLPDQWDNVSATFEKMVLLEVHDTVDITDFSRLSDTYRCGKEKRKQEWAEIESDFVSTGPRPEKVEPSAVSDVKAATHSAYPE